MDSLSPKELEYSDLFAETVKAQAQTASAESSRADHRLGELSQQLEQIDRLLVEVKEQRDRLEALRKQKEIYGLLFKHLAGNQLQDYVVSALLQQLMESANHFLKDLTQGRYLLDLEKDNFVVQDAWASGESRIVETLSGGESFVVSLALALALSDFMKGGASLESLFIDEGFGSLHRDKLDLVYEALGALSGAGKVIGLVTHLEELAGRFPARLHVSNTPSGSEVHLVRTESEW
jgi:exonuclease SbcC